MTAATSNTTSSGAFQHLAPVAADYVTPHIADGFNWQHCAVAVGPGEWYLVVFRSFRRTEADDAVLTEFDDDAYMEALQAGGLLFYFRGTLTEQRECLSFCLWESRDQARAASDLPLHRRAVAITSATYVTYRLERYRVHKDSADSPLLFDALPLAPSQVH
jgi:hypothetical protein